MKVRSIAFTTIVAVGWSALVFLATTSSGCAYIEKVDATNPSAVAPAPGFPCGQVRVYCGQDDAGAATCCPEYTTCGAEGRSCPADSCCYIGSDGTGVGTRRPTAMGHVQ